MLFGVFRGLGPKIEFQGPSVPESNPEFESPPWAKQPGTSPSAIYIYKYKQINKYIYIYIFIYLFLYLFLEREREGIVKARTCGNWASSSRHAESLTQVRPAKLRAQ